PGIPFRCSWSFVALALHQQGQHGLSRDLLRLPPAAALAFGMQAGIQYRALDAEQLVVRLAAHFQDLVHWQRLAQTLQIFLQAGLGILELGHRRQLLQAVLVKAQNQLAAGHKAAVEIDRTDDSLQAVGQYRFAAVTAALDLAAAKSQVLSQLQRPRYLGQAAAVDQCGAQAAEHALAFLRAATEQLVGDDEIERAIAKKLQTLVVATLGAAMGQRLDQQILIAELIA